VTASAAQTTALVVIDMQHYFCEPGQTPAEFVALGAPDERTWYYEHVEKFVVPRIAQFRGQPSLVVFTDFGSRSADGSDLPLWARRHNEQCRAQLDEPCYLPLSDPASRVIEPLQPRPDELIIQKSTSGPLAGTDITHQLRQRQIETVVAVGVATSVCVLGMARELADSDFDVLVVSDACAAPGRSAHEAALALLSASFATVAPTEEVYLAAL
jgi:nicotinamidase-related amidase